MLVSVLFAVGLLAAPQDNNKSKQDIANETYEATEGATQVTIIGRGVTSPQENNLSEQQIANFKYNSTLGADQVYVNESSAQDFLGDNLNILATPTPNAVVYSDNSGDYVFLPLGDANKVLTSNGATSAPTWETGGGGNDFVEYVNITGVAPPYLQVKNTTAEDTDGGREGKLYFKGVKSGGEESTLITITGQHSGAGDDDKGELTIQPSEDSTGCVQVLDADGGTPIWNVDCTNERVGIGIAAPNEQLELSGNIRLETDTQDSQNGIIYKGTALFLHTHSGSVNLKNLFLGVGSGNLTNTGTSNFGAGNGTLASLSSGNYNVVAGDNAGNYITSGARHVLLGRSAGQRFDDDTGSVALGYGAMLFVSSGTTANDNNVAIGNEAGRYYGAASDQLLAATDTILIGANTRPSADSSVNEIVIGTDAIGNGDNTVTIGNASHTTVYFPDYHRSIDINASAAAVGGTAPQGTITGTFYGLAFDADAEVAYFEVEVPEDWDGSSDMALKIYWHPEDGDAPADTETVKWDATYRSIDEGEAVDNGTAVDITGTYTQSGAGTDKELIETEITIDYDDTDQPLAVGDLIGFVFNRDVTTDTYSGDGIVLRWEVDYTSNSLPVH